MNAPTKKTSPRRRSRRRVVLWVLGSITGLVLLAVVGLGVGYHFITHPSVPAAVKGKTTIAAVGDSNTYGFGVLFDDIGSNSYPAQVEAGLDEDYQVLNYGLIGGTLLPTSDTPWTDYPFMEASHDVNPSAVLIMLGTNDSKPQNWDAAEYRTQLITFAQSYSELPSSPDVYLLTPPAAYENSFDVDPTVVQEEVAPIVRDVAAAGGYTLVDVFAATEGKPDLFPDGVHPDAAGYELIADTVLSAIEE